MLASGYGDCKDKHTLLAALLAAEGITAEPVLIGSGIDFDKDLTSFNDFNHVITAVELPGGRRLWLDSTEEVAPPGMLIATLRDKDALLIPATGPSVLVKTPADPPFSAADHYEATGVLTPAGKLTAHFTATLHGDLELYCRMALFGGGPAQWLSIGQGISTGLGFGGTVSAFTPIGVDNPEKPLAYSYDYERDSYGDWDDHKILPLLPYNLFGGGANFTAQPGRAITLGAPRVETATSTITLPSGFSAPTMPSDAHIQSAFGSFDLAYTRKGEQIIATARMEIRSDTLPATEWQKYNDFFKAISDTQQFIQLSTASAAASAAAPAPVHVNVEAAGAVQQAFRDLGAGDTAAARRQLQAAQAADPNGRGVWAIASLVAAADRRWTEADSDLAHEIALYPDEKDHMLTEQLWLER